MKILKTVILAIIFLLLLSLSSLAAEGTVTASSLKLRKEPSLDGEVLYGISKDAKVEIIEKTDDKWYKVNYNGDTGYVAAEYIKTEDAFTTATPEPTPVVTEAPVEIEEPTETEQIAYTTANQIDVYILPVINSSIINKLEANTSVNLIKKINKWAYIELNSNYGWVIYDKLVADIVTTEETPSPSPSPEVTPSVAPEATPIDDSEAKEETTSTPEVTQEPEVSTKKTGYINVSTYANLRKEPSTDSTVLDTLQRNTEVTVVLEENGWAKVEVRGMTGYISKDLISNTKLEEIDTSSRGTSAQREPEKPTEDVNIAETNTNGSAIVDFAKKYLGYKYVLGGTTPSGGFDCSGFVYYVFGQMGKSISRSLSVQATTGVEVSKANLQIGDIVIFNDSSNSSLGHVGIYVGNSQFVHAANPKRGVVIDYLDSRNSYYNERYVTARRV